MGTRKKIPVASNGLRPEPALPPAASICVFLDVDGTLVEFADTPGGVSVDPLVFDMLRRLQGALDGALALVSGRSIADMDRILAPLQLPAAGLHGLERRDALGRMHVPELDDSPLEPVRVHLQQFVAAHAGLLLEDKNRALAVHYRRAPDLRDAVWRAMSTAAAGLSPAFKLLEGDMVLELKPGRFDKAAAVEAFMREAPFRGRIPVFVGDDVTDYDGFAAVRRHDGITVAVGPRVTAQWYLPDPPAACAWLLRIAEQGGSLGR
jgi:trehalose 6-phosphate phosphatase